MNLSWFTNNSQNSLHTSNHLLIEITFLGIILWNKRIFALSNGCQKFPKASQSVLRNVLWHWLCVALIVCRNPSLIWREPFSFGFLRLQLCLELVWGVCWCMLTGRFCGHKPFEKLCFHSFVVIFVVVQTVKRKIIFPVLCGGLCCCVTILHFIDYFLEEQ